MRREAILAAASATIATAMLVVLIVVGSRRLSHFDAALIGYTFASLFAAFGLFHALCRAARRPA